MSELIPRGDLLEGILEGEEIQEGDGKLIPKGELVGVMLIEQGKQGIQGPQGDDYVITQADYNAIANIVKQDIVIPTKTSQLINDDNTVKDGSYVHTDNNYTSTEKNKLAGIESNAEVNKIDNISVNNVRQTISNKEVNIILPEDAEYTIVESETTSGYSKSYSLTKDGVEVGVKINIPKDLVVSSGDVKVVTTDDVPYVGARVGDKYIDLILNDPNANHIYIPVKDLVDVYTSGNGIDVSSGNVISLVLDTTNANGLSLTVSGLRLALASTSNNGAMSLEDKTKLNNIETGAEVNIIETVKVNNTSLTPDVNKAVNITVPTKTSDLTNDDNVVKDASYVHTDNNYTTTEKNKLSGIEAQANKTVVDDALSSSSTNPVQNKAINTALGNKVDKVSGKGLSTNDYTTEEKTKLFGIATGAEVNVIETVKVNGTAQTVTNKSVDISVPINNNQLTNGAGYQTASQVSTAISNAIDGKENISNKVTSISSSSTDIQYPSAKCVYDLIGNIESLLSEV